MTIFEHPDPRTSNSLVIYFEADHWKEMEALEVVIKKRKQELGDDLKRVCSLRSFEIRKVKMRR